MTDESKSVVKSSDFKSRGDWIDRLLTDHCVDAHTGTKKGKAAINVKALTLFTRANGVKIKDGGYPNVGMLRMNVGNMLRAKARKQGALMAPKTMGLVDEATDFVMTSAPPEFSTNLTAV